MMPVEESANLILLCAAIAKMEGNAGFASRRDGGDGKNGVTKVFHEDSPDKYTLVADVKTIYGARTISLDPKTHHIFTIGTEKNDPFRRRKRIRIRGRGRTRARFNCWRSAQRASAGCVAGLRGGVAG